MNSNGPPRNYCGALEVNLKTCTKGTKWKVYTGAQLNKTTFLLWCLRLETYKLRVPLHLWDREHMQSFFHLLVSYQKLSFPSLVHWFSLANHLSTLLLFILAISLYLFIYWVRLSMISIHLLKWDYEFSNLQVEVYLKECCRAHSSWNPNVKNWKFGWNFKDSGTLTWLELEESERKQRMSNYYKILYLIFLSLFLYFCTWGEWT